MAIPRTSTSIALQETKRKLREEQEFHATTRRYYEELAKLKQGLEDQCRNLANERDEARRELHECHEVFNQLEGNRARATLFGTESVKSLPGRLACFLAKLRAA